jgi:hypothetical protein
MVPRQPDTMEQIVLEDKVAYISQLKHRFVQYSTKPFWQDLACLSHMERDALHHYSMNVSSTTDQCGGQNWPSISPPKYDH